MSDAIEIQRHESVPPILFERKYAASADPWEYATSAYEARKYAATLAALPRERYRAGFEIGCSVGVLTRRLARRCDTLLAVDVSDLALDRARERCHDLPGMRFARMRVPAETPAGPFDLVVLSEVGYYWGRADLCAARRALAGLLEPGGQLLLVHWTPPIDDAPLAGDSVHAAFLDDARLRPLVSRREETWRLDLLERRH